MIINPVVVALAAVVEIPRFNEFTEMMTCKLILKGKFHFHQTTL
jgi:hypothetical protein